MMNVKSAQLKFIMEQAMHPAYNITRLTQSQTSVSLEYKTKICQRVLLAYIKFNSLQSTYNWKRIPHIHDHKCKYCLFLSVPLANSTIL